MTDELKDLIDRWISQIEKLEEKASRVKEGSPEYIQLSARATQLGRCSHELRNVMEAK